MGAARPSERIGRFDLGIGPARSHVQRFSVNALTATRRPDPDMDNAIPARSTRLNIGSNTAAMGRGGGAVADGPAEVLPHFAYGATAHAQRGGDV